MTARKLTLLVFLVFLVMVSATGLFASESSIIKNVSVFLPDGTWQADSFIIIRGCKIEKIGRMNTLKPGETGIIVGNEYDLKGSFVYPTFIDPMFKGFLKTEKDMANQQRLMNQVTPPIGRGREFGRQLPGPEDTVRKPLEERNYFTRRNVVDLLQLDETKEKELIGSGFGIVQVMHPDGIISGTTAVISLVSVKIPEAVLVPEHFLALYFKPNQADYPEVRSSIVAELKQLKEDSFYYQKMKQLMFYHPVNRLQYSPALDALYPYFTKEKRFLVVSTNYTEQRLGEILKQELDVNPAWVVSSDAWRRTVKPEADIILPLDFAPPSRSFYAVQGEKFQKEAEEKIYPQKLAEFIKSHKNVSFSAPNESDYKKLFINIRVLMKQGMTEAEIIRCLTVNPARLLDISRYAGTIEPGKLASIMVFDQKIDNPEARVKMAFVEGKVFEFKESKDKEKKSEHERGRSGPWNRDERPKDIGGPK